MHDNWIIHIHGNNDHYHTSPHSLNFLMMFLKKIKIKISNYDVVKEIKNKNY